jgi:uncharacterized protein YkwD
MLMTRNFFNLAMVRCEAFTVADPPIRLMIGWQLNRRVDPGLPRIQIRFFVSFFMQSKPSPSGFSIDLIHAFMRLIRSVLLVAGITLVTSPLAHAQENSGLLDLVNAFRAAPGTCNGRQAKPVSALVSEAALGRVSMAPGTYLPYALEKAGYAAEQAEGIYVSGPANARDVFETIQASHCKTLLSAQYSAAGVVRNGNDWLLVLVRPQRLPQLPEWTEAGKAILQRVNEARAVSRTCGDRFFAAAPPLAWNSSLAAAALAHSRDMAEQRYFSHQGKDGSDAGERARRAGYQWRRIGENIASGQQSPEEAVAGWLSSPGHCANLMNPGFTEMGAAYAFKAERRSAVWTQVFGTPP